MAEIGVTDDTLVLGSARLGSQASAATASGCLSVSPSMVVPAGHARFGGSDVDDGCVVPIAMPLKD